MIVIYLLMALLGSAATIFALQNRDPVEIWFLAWGVKGMPLALVILLSLLVGVVFTSLTRCGTGSASSRTRWASSSRPSRSPRHRPTRRRAPRRLPSSPAEPGEKEGAACPEALATVDPQAPNDVGRGKIYPRSV